MFTLSPEREAKYDNQQYLVHEKRNLYVHLTEVKAQMRSNKAELNKLKIVRNEAMLCRNDAMLYRNEAML